MLPAVLAGVLALPVLAAAQPASPPRERQAPRPPAADPARAQTPEGHVPLTLSEAVFLSLRNNRGIRSQYIQRVQDRFNLRVAQYQFEPQASIQGGAVNFNQSRSLQQSFVFVGPPGAQIRVPAAPQGFTSQNIALSAGPQASITLPTGGQFTASWQVNQFLSRGSPASFGQGPQVSFTQPLLRGAGEVATANLRAARLSEIESQINLRGTVAQQVTAVITAYRTLLQSQEQVRIATESLRRARDLVEVNRALVAAGRLAQVELIQGEQNIAQQELSLLQSQNALQAARLALLTLLALDHSSRIWAVERPSAEAVRVNLPVALQAAQNTRPAVLTSQLAVERARIQLEVARNNRLWDVGVSGSASLPVTGSNPNTAFDQITRQRPGFALGLTFNIPLTDVDRQAQEVTAVTALRRAEIAVADAQAQLRESVENAVRNIETQRRSADLARRARELAAQQLEAELVRLQAGRTSNFQVVSFQDRLRQAELAELQAVISYVNALTTLDLELGTTIETWRISLNDG
jgi:outer membrane protein TolC